ncbi:hypothetical protein GCM10027436_58130 [Actinophytocola sediminis]|jgi:hypothetical protein
MGGGAWPFLVRGVICLVNSDNERDLILLITQANSFGLVYVYHLTVFLERLSA